MSVSILRPTRPPTSYDGGFGLVGEAKEVKRAARDGEIGGSPPTLYPISRLLYQSQTLHEFPMGRGIRVGGRRSTT